MASRMAARSTTAGTPVKSWSSTRAGVKEISRLGSSVATQRATASTSVAGDRRPVLEPQDVLEQHPQRVGEPDDVVRRLERLEAEDLVGPAADRERRLGPEAVAHLPWRLPGAR